jgi:hypothetical protein
MKHGVALISLFILLTFSTSCASNIENQTPVISVETVAAIVNATLSAMPTAAPTLAFTDTPTPIEEAPTAPMSTSTSVQILVPLYWEVTWENLGRLEQELLINQQTNERIILSGYIYQAPLPSEKNDLTVNVNMYYSNENLLNMGWKFIMGGGGVDGMLTEFYNETGYFLMVRTSRGQSPSITVWISDATTVVPVIPVY